MHPLGIHHDSDTYLTLSVEALWIARVLHDALDVVLENPCLEDAACEERLRALRMKRDVFERLGIQDASTERVSPWSMEWSAHSRVELIRQVAVHWRAFIDTSFGSSLGSKLIMGLSDDEIRLLEAIQRFSYTLQMNHATVTHCMQQQMEVMAHQQQSRRAQRHAAFQRPLDAAA